MSKEKIEVGDWVRIKGGVKPKKYRKRLARVEDVGRGWMNLTVGDEGGLIFESYEVDWVPANEVPDEIRFKGHPSTHVAEKSSTFADLVTQRTTAIADLLVEKNRKYGDSALNPANVFSKANAVEALKVRIDDKINRIRQGETDDTEDSVTDLIGYLILLQIATEEAK